MVVSDAINNIMGGMESTAGVRLHNHRRKLKQRFDLIKKLGQGTYGKVQLGINKETGQEVAIKTIKKSKIETEADLIRIRREIQIMSSVHHPNIIHIYEVFENRDKMVLVMEYAAGGELYDFLSDRKVLIESEARRIFRQISTAVFYCHKHNICHRDLKLENILLDEHGSAKIADFGLSNVYASGVLLATYCGSPLYASPEIVQGTPYRGPEVDCWSLGVLLYTLVYGAMPFDGSNFKRLVKQISTGDYFEPKKPSAASPLIRAMLCVDPTTRADITAICSHWWMNQGQSHTCLELAEELANQVPVRLDLLLSLVPPTSVTPAAGEASAATPGPARSMSVGSLVELDRPRAEVKRRSSAAGQEGKEEAVKRKLEPSPLSMEEANQGAKRKERSKRREPSADRSRRRSVPPSGSAAVPGSAGLPGPVARQESETKSVTLTDSEPVSCSSSKMDVDEDSISIADVVSEDKKVKVKRKKKTSEDKSMKQDSEAKIVQESSDKVAVKAVEKVKKKEVTEPKEVSPEEVKVADKPAKKEVIEAEKMEVTEAEKPSETAEATSDKLVEVKPVVEAKPTKLAELKGDKSNESKAEKMAESKAEKPVVESKIPVETKPSDTKPAETKPDESKPVESKPVEAKPVESKPVEAKPADTKPGETKPVEIKPGETKPVETKPGEAKPGVIKKKLSVKKVPLVDKGEKGEEAPKPMVRRRSKVFESEIQKFNNMSAAELRSPTVEKPKKVFIPGVKVSDFKKAYEQPPVVASPSKKAVAKPSEPPAKDSSPEDKPANKEASPKKEAKKEEVVAVKSVQPKDDETVKVKVEASKEPIPKKDDVSVKAKAPQKEPSQVVVPVESVKPVLPAKPVESTKPVEVVKPTESVKPLLPVKVVELVKPVESVKPAEPEPSLVKDEVKASTEDAKTKTQEMSKLKKNAIEIIGNAIAKPPKPMLEKIKPKPNVRTQDAGDAACGPLSPKSPVSPSGTKLVRIQVAPGEMRNAVLKVSTPELTKNVNYVAPLPGAPAEAAEAEKPKVSSKVEITLKSATLPRRQTSTAEIQLSQPSRPEYRTEVERSVGGAPKHQRSEVAFPVAAAPASMPARSVSMEPEGKPRERIIPIRFEREVSEPVRAQAESPRVQPSEPSLSRQNTTESEGEAIRKSPREYIIPIAVEGGGYITPRAVSAEPEQRTPQRLLPRAHRISLLGESEDEGFNSPFSSLSRHQSEQMEGELEHMHRLRSSRPRKAQVERAESLSSGEEDDEDGFELLTAESLFSTLLSRVRNLTQRLNVDDGGRPAFPHGRFISHNFPQHSAFFDHMEPMGRRVSETSRPASRTDSWRRSVSRDGDQATEATQPRGPPEYEVPDAQYTPSLSRRMQQARSAHLPPPAPYATLPSRRPILRTTSLKSGDDRRRGGYRSASVDRGDSGAPLRRNDSSSRRSLAESEAFGSTESLNRPSYAREQSYVPLRRNDSTSRRPSSVAESNDLYGSSESLNRQSLRRNDSSRRPSSVAESNEPYGSNDSLNRPVYSREQSYVPLRRNNSASRRLEPVDPYGSTDSLNRSTYGYTSPRYNLPSPGESKDPLGSSERSGYYTQNQGYVPLRRDNSASRHDAESALTRQNIAAMTDRVPARRNQYRSSMSDTLDYTRKPPSYLRQRAIDIANIYSPGLQDDPRRPSAYSPGAQDDQRRPNFPPERPTTLDIAPAVTDDQPKSPGRRVSRFLRPDFYDTPREDSAFVKSPREETGRTKHIQDFLEMNYADLERNIAKDLRAIGENSQEIEVRNGKKQDGAQVSINNGVQNIVAKTEARKVLPPKDPVNNIGKKIVKTEMENNVGKKMVTSVNNTAPTESVKKQAVESNNDVKNEVINGKSQAVPLKETKKEEVPGNSNVGVPVRTIPVKKMIGMDVTSDKILISKDDTKPKLAKKKLKKPDEEVKLRPKKESSNKTKFLRSLERSSLPVKRATSVDDCSAPGKVVRVIRSLRELVSTPSVALDSETSLIQRATSSDDVTRPGRVTSVLGMFGARGAARWRRTQSVCVDDKRASLDLDSTHNLTNDTETSKVNHNPINSTSTNMDVGKSDSKASKNSNMFATNATKSLGKKNLAESKAANSNGNNMSVDINSLPNGNNGTATKVNNFVTKDANANQSSVTSSINSAVNVNNIYTRNLNKSQDFVDSGAENQAGNTSDGSNNSKSTNAKPPVTLASASQSNSVATNGVPVRVKSPRLPAKAMGDQDDLAAGESIEERIRRKSFYSRFNDGKKRRASAIPTPREASIPRRSASFVNHSEEC